MNLETVIAVMLTSIGNARLAGHGDARPLEAAEQQDFQFIFGNGDGVRALSPG
jgi:hypothetical protein